MTQVFAATLPILVVVAVGFACTKAGMFAAAEMGTLNRFVVRVALPLLVFLSLAGRSLAEVFQPTYLATYALAALFMAGVAQLWARLTGASGTDAAFLGVAMGGTSNGVIGLTLFLIIVPDVATLAVSMDMLVDNVLIIPLALFLAERSVRAGHGSAWQTAARALRGAVLHPIVIAVAAALLLNAIGLTVLPLVADSAHLLAQASSGVGLFAIVGLLTQLDLRATRGRVTVTLVGKLLVMPAVAVLLVLALEAVGLPPLSTQLKAAAVLTAALPTFTILPALASTYDVDEWTTATTAGCPAPPPAR